MQESFCREQCQSLNQKLVAIQLENITLSKECQKLQKVNANYVHSET